MMISIIRLIGALGAVMVTTIAVPMCNSDSSASASTQSAANAASVPTSAQTVAATAGPGLPADFPLAPGLSACKPTVVGGEIICEWHSVNGHAIYTFYHEALPKAGYTLVHGAQEVTTPRYQAGMGFKKGSAQGAVYIVGGDLTIQYLPHE
ncbi:MAG: hypothetical protein ACHQRL_07915 [Gemmatimonadales bacterium]|jgi:hypothetical protein